MSKLLLLLLLLAHFIGCSAASLVLAAMAGVAHVARWAVCLLQCSNI